MKQPRTASARKRRTASFVLAVLVVLACGGVGAVPSADVPAGPNPQRPISVTSELVPLPVSVTDAQGNFVSGLARDDFRVFEEHQFRQITLFEQENTPVSVGLLVDHSSSMGSKLPGVVAAIAGFTRSSNPQDEMFVVDFGDRARIERFAGKTFTSNPREIENAVAVSAAGRTALYDAVAAGLGHFAQAHRGRKALVIVSDGGDNASSYKFSQVLSMARASEVTIYAVGLLDEAGEEENPKILEQLCKDTGGIAFFPRLGPAVGDAMDRIAQDLREQYMLGFVPGVPAGKVSFRKLQVKVVAPGHEKLRVRSRPGYLSGMPLDDTPADTEKGNNP